MSMLGFILQSAWRSANTELVLPSYFKPSDFIFLFIFLLIQFGTIALEPKATLYLFYIFFISSVDNNL